MRVMSPQELVLTAFVAAKLSYGTPEFLHLLEQLLLSPAETALPSSSKLLTRQPPKRRRRFTYNRLDDLHVCTSLFDGPSKGTDHDVEPPAYEPHTLRVCTLSSQHLVDLVTSTATMGFQSFKLSQQFQQCIRFEDLSLPLVCQFGAALAQTESLATLEAQFVPNLTFWIAFRRSVANKLLSVVTNHDAHYSSLLSSVSVECGLDLLDTVGHICSHDESCPRVSPSWDFLVLFPLLHCCLPLLRAHMTSYTLPHFARMFRAFRFLVPHLDGPPSPHNFAGLPPQVSLPVRSRPDFVATLSTFSTALPSPCHTDFAETSEQLLKAQLQPLLFELVVSLCPALTSCLASFSSLSSASLVEKNFAQLTSIGYSLATLFLCRPTDSSLRSSVSDANDATLATLKALGSRVTQRLPDGVSRSIQLRQLEVISCCSKTSFLPTEIDRLLDQPTVASEPCLIPAPPLPLSMSLSRYLKALQLHHDSHHCIRGITIVPALCYVNNRSVALLFCGHRDHNEHVALTGLKALEIGYLRSRGYDVIVIPSSWWSNASEKTKTDTLRYLLTTIDTSSCEAYRSGFHYENCEGVLLYARSNLPPPSEAKPSYT